ncbi:DJ-1/PfpI family protein [Amycolatopsis sp.]|uniref:DJ-1/PfpI family protein n=1 Tax=Amycolatopsis sp. TaxID=37632 RepID=UPI002D80392E|nr:DJ-1/PfpI family protein [Amycolatopsis sp.]HET6707567.1 DJ-1/PfpI family protein [Amycolatopsis sp.]
MDGITAGERIPDAHPWPSSCSSTASTRSTPSPGITLTATAALDPTAPGYVVVPGAADDDPHTVPVLLGRFAASAAAPLLRRCLDAPAVTVATVCGGSPALAMAGLLAGRTATTHVFGIDALEAAGVTAVRARVVDDGDLVTAGGVTSGRGRGPALTPGSAPTTMAP